MNDDKVMVAMPRQWAHQAGGIVGAMAPWPGDAQRIRDACRSSLEAEFRVIMAAIMWGRRHQAAEFIRDQMATEIAKIIERPKCEGSYCGGKNPATKAKHTCPYAEDVHGDYNPEACACCDMCRLGCTQDI